MTTVDIVQVFFDGVEEITEVFFNTLMADKRYLELKQEYSDNYHIEINQYVMNIKNSYSRDFRADQDLPDDILEWIYNDLDGRNEFTLIIIPKEE